MFPYNNQILPLMFVRILVQEPEQERRLSDRQFSWQRAARKAVRRLGITLMRVGGKMVYWGTGEPEIEFEVSNVSE
ncbi:hypothetical protein [Dictyobacter aurantiacus]|uniref:Uncharacterized protein n=1 Tax=Dictyobacter aurantiacus TaxID=1936993 RepID=A0A401ZNL4_9CHLR|nr:hypothetical protein [Dictyobacter aurantiacus]GCE08477.1 hypothetical protein KDAU_58060 [Dictyobacter aurantiacus]